MTMARVITVNQLRAGHMTISWKTSQNTAGWETLPGQNSQQTLQRVRRGRSCFGAKTNLKSWLVRDCVHVILTREQLQNDGHAVGFPKHFYWNNYGLVLNPRKSGAVEKRAQAEAAVASPPAALPLGTLYEYTRTPRHCASTSPGSGAIFRRKSYILAFFAYCR